MTELTKQGFDDATPESNVTLGVSTSLNNATSRTGAGGSGVLAGTTSTITVTFTPSAATVTGFGFRTESSYGTTVSWFSLMEGATVHLSLRFNASGQIELYRGDGTTLLQASTTWTAPPLGTWFYVEVKASIADSGGTCEVRVGETTFINYTGDTRNGGTAGTPDRVRLGVPAASTQTRFDDLYVLNTSGSAPANDFLGDVVVRTQALTGNGDSSQFVGSDGNSTDNYLLADETNSSMTDYVGSATSGNRDLYQFADLPAGYDVLSVQEIVYAQASDGGTPPTLRAVAKGQAGTVRADTAFPTLSTTAVLYAAENRTTDPDGNALTAARVNAMQVGVEIV